MNSRAKAMLIATVLLCTLLVTKSLWIDPVGPLEGDYLKYKNYALNIAPYQPGILIVKSPVIDYKVVSVKKISNSGITNITYIDENGEWVEETLEGEYKARVRTYLLSVLPFRDIQIRGGKE